jgi:hypothetical protein
VLSISKHRGRAARLADRSGFRARIIRAELI